MPAFFEKIGKEALNELTRKSDAARKRHRFFAPFFGHKREHYRKKPIKKVAHRKVVSHLEQTLKLYFL